MIGYYECCLALVVDADVKNNPNNEALQSKKESKFARKEVQNHYLRFSYT